MAELSARIIARASAVSGEAPLAADLAVAEIAVNTADGKLFTKHTDDSIKEISGSGGGGGAVDSVNGETGVISLGIQDMDDFELYEDDGSAGVTIYHFGPAPNWASSVDAQQWTGNGANILYARSPDLNGANFNPAVASHDLSQGVYVSTDGSNFTLIPSVTAGYSNAANDNLIGITSADWGPLQPQFIAENLSTDLYIALEQPSETSLIPLAEGDILQWNNVDQKFKPAQLPAIEGGDYVSKTTLKSEVAASADFADFQSRIAAL